MADAMKLVPVERLQYAIDAIAHLQPHKARRELENLLAASPPAREEAPAEGAGEWTPTRGQVINAICNASPFGPDYKHPDLLRMSDAILAIRNRTSEPEAGAVAWRVRQRVMTFTGQPGPCWGYGESPTVSADDTVYEQQALYLHPAPATADKLRERYAYVGVMVERAINEGSPDSAVAAAARASLAALNEGGE